MPPKTSSAGDIIQRALPTKNCCHRLLSPPPGIFVKKSEHYNQIDGSRDEMVARRWHWKIVGRIIGD
jgi:hypothetical protein